MKTLLVTILVTTLMVTRTGSEPSPPPSSLDVSQLSGNIVRNLFNSMDLFWTCVYRHNDPRISMSREFISGIDSGRPLTAEKFVHLFLLPGANFLCSSNAKFSQVKKFASRRDSTPVKVDFTLLGQDSCQQDIGSAPVICFHAR